VSPREHFSTANSVLARPGDSVATCQPAGAQLSSETQRNTAVQHSEPQSASQPVPPGKQRLICSVEVPGIGRAAKVNCIKFTA